MASEVHHIKRCQDDPALQTDKANLESLCAICHAGATSTERRGFSKELDEAGYYTDPNHPTNRGRHRLKFGTDASKLQRNKSGGRIKHFDRCPWRPAGVASLSVYPDFLLITKG